jgi:hypothetical protein
MSSLIVVTGGSEEVVESELEFVKRDQDARAAIAWSF